MKKLEESPKTRQGKLYSSDGKSRSDDIAIAINKNLPQIEENQKSVRKPIIEEIAIAKIKRDRATQQRTALNHDVVKEYAEEIKNGAKFPPVKLKFDGENYWLIDGFHTVAASFYAHKESVEAEITPGTKREAILESFGANASHGLRRTNLDKRRAVSNMLLDEEWSQWSDREIARRCKVSQPFVSNLRKNLTENIISDNQRIYKDKHGNVSVMNCENIGKSQQSQQLENPESDKLNNCPDKDSTVQISCPDKNETVQTNKPLISSYQVGQVVIIDSCDRTNKDLVGYKLSKAVITAVNPASLNLKIWQVELNNVAPQDVKPIGKRLLQNFWFEPEHFSKIMQTYDSMEDAIAAIPV